MAIEILRFKAADEYSPEDKQEMRALIAQLPDETLERLLHYYETGILVGADGRIIPPSTRH